MRDMIFMLAITIAMAFGAGVMVGNNHLVGWTFLLVACGFGVAIYIIQGCRCRIARNLGYIEGAHGEEGLARAQEKLGAETMQIGAERVEQTEKGEAHGVPGESGQAADAE